MATVWPLPLLLLLSVFPRCSLGVESLKCLNDYVSNVTCVWDSTGVDPEAVCTLSTLDHGTKRACSLKRLEGPQQHLRSCHLIFQDTLGRLSKFDIKAECENLSSPAASIKDYLLKHHIKMHPPGLPSCTNSTITWSPGEPLSRMIFSYSFQLQYKTSDQTWEEVQSIDVKDKQRFLQLPEDRLVLGTVYHTRVRVKTDEDSLSGEWSDWSPIASWSSTVGSSPSGSSKGQDSSLNLRLLVIIPAVLVCLLLIFILKTKGFNWAYGGKPIPDPSKFFKVLNSVHNGNFQKWQRRRFAPESFSAPQFAEDISTVEVTNIRHARTHYMERSHHLSEGCDVSSQPSSFLNMDYFCSNHENDGCSNYVGCRAAGSSAEGNAGVGRMNDSGPLQNSSSYQLLEQLPLFMCPDSCLGARAEHKEEDNLPK